ncbi:hypothetical protein G9A89_003669 [Geosiphon pyriformis]|nr:hypothetical protein G9A89_003669 [Geosiphon pyriformis]
MNLVSSSADSSGSVLAGLGIRSSTKKKIYIENIYFCSSAYKKSKKSNVTGVVVNSSAGLISINILQAVSSKYKMFWSSEVESEETSINGVSNVKNMNNMIAEKMNYINSNTSKTDNMEVIIKKIPVDLPKSVVKSVFSKFGKIISIKMQLIGLWQKTLVEYESSEVADLVTAK